MDPNDSELSIPAPPVDAPSSFPAPPPVVEIDEGDATPARSRRRGWWAGLAAVVVLAVAGATVALAAGGSDSRPTVVSAGVLTRAAAETQDAKSARLAIEMAIEADGHSIDFSGDGVMTTVNGHPELSLHIAMDPIGTIDERLIGQVLYMRIQTTDSSAAVAGGKWLKVDLAEIAAAKPEMRAALEQLKGNAGGADPTSALASLKAISDDITEVGREQVKAGMATRYNGTLDGAKIADQARKTLGSDVPSSFDSIVALLGKVPVSLWVDDDGRLVKMQMRFDLGAMSGGKAKGSMRMAFEYYDFGASVSVEAPPADQTVDGFDFLTGSKTS